MNKLKNFLGCLFITLLFIFITSSAGYSICEDPILKYEQDFSADLDWEINNLLNFLRLPTANVLYAKTIEGTEEYAKRSP